MSDEFVVDRGVSRYGLHLVHVLRAGRPVDVEGVMEKEAPPGAEMMTLAYEEEALGTHHLQLFWKENGKGGFDGWIKG